MVKDKNATALKGIKALLAPLDAPARRQLLWRLLTASLAGKPREVKWFLDEFEKFMEAECRRLEEAGKSKMKN